MTKQTKITDGRTTYTVRLNHDKHGNEIDNIYKRFFVEYDNGYSKGVFGSVEHMLKVICNGVEFFEFFELTNELKYIIFEIMRTKATGEEYKNLINYSNVVI